MEGNTSIGRQLKFRFNTSMLSMSFHQKSFLENPIFEAKLNLKLALLCMFPPITIYSTTVRARQQRPCTFCYHLFFMYLNLILYKLHSPQNPKWAFLYFESIVGKIHNVWKFPTSLSNYTKMPPNVCNLQS